MKYSAIMLLSSLFLSNAFAADMRRFEGELSLNVEDYQQHAISHYQLQDSQGQHHDLWLSEAPKWLRPGQRIRVFGKAIGKQLQVTDNNISLLQSTETLTSTQTVSASSAMVAGEHSVLVAEVNFAINPIVKFTQAEIQELLFNQSAAFYAESSYGAMTLSGDVASAVTVDVDVSVCNTDALAQAADSELNARGYNLEGYDHIMYLMPTHPKCTWSGKANVVGKRSWIKRVQLSTINHELGHNLGLYHANKKDCGDLTTKDSSECTIYEYGDYLSAMSGTNTAKHFNAFHKEQLGWLSGNRVVTVQSDTRVTLSPAEFDGNFPLLLKIPNGQDSAGNARFYYIEYRQAVGFDAALASDAPGMLDGIRLREGVTNNPASSYLLDPTPNSSDYDWDDISLSPGQVYEQQGVRLEVVASDAASVTLDVSMPSASAQCVRASSTLTAQNSVAQLQQGQQASIDLLLVNNDSNGCSDAVYSLSVQHDDGLYTSLSSTNITLAPESSTHLTLAVTAIQDSGSNAWQVDGTRQASSQTLVAGGNIMLSQAISNTAPQALDDSFSNITGATVLNVMANDSDADGDVLQVSGTTQGQYGKVVVNPDNTLTYTPSKRFKGSDHFSYSITDGEFTSSATVTISNSASSSGSGTTVKGGGKGKNG
ncbi:Ig-like domain-containing protein [Shewanella dokdonensis]|uniref:Ig-like domain-containing protein n=1 Tax=Shewanella dokdonensis TaxID=712036 RepID=UPI00200C8B3A|nr:Ig-like domain-containing protein [Shewanella dokdonensis]MCL1075140.1 Ig-like domain-containing protein [Shewanella dokdonensis]